MPVRPMMHTKPAVGFEPTAYWLQVNCAAVAPCRQKMPSAGVEPLIINRDYKMALLNEIRTYCKHSHSNKIPYLITKDSHLDLLLRYITYCSSVLFCGWNMRGLNPPSPVCKTGVTPLRLMPHIWFAGCKNNRQAGKAGFEPATLRLTAECSACWATCHYVSLWRE